MPRSALVTKAAVVAFDTPSASAVALAGMQSAEYAGLQRGRVNVKLPVGGEDVGSAGGQGPGDCFVASILRDGRFRPDPKAEPVCGTVIEKVEH